MTEMTDERSASLEASPAVLTVREAALRLGVATGTIVLWIKKGVLTPLRRSTAGYLLPVDEVVRVEQQRQQRRMPTQ